MTFHCPVFGVAPAGVACHPRRAAYVVIAGPGARVAVIRARLQDGTSRCWLPGGGMAADETPEEAVAREVREELGRGIRVQGPIVEALQYFYASDEDRWYEMRASFLQGVFDESPACAGEFELHWMDPREDAQSFFHECHAWAASRA